MDHGLVEAHGDAMETTNNTNPPSEHQAPGRRLTRSSQDKVVSGLCGGLGRHFGVDPVIFRIAFVVLALAGGTGLLLYLVGWLLVPDETSGRAAFDGVSGNRLATVIVAVLIGCAVLAVIDNVAWDGDDDAGLAVILFALAAAVLWFRRNDQGGQPAPPSPPVSPGPPESAGPPAPAEPSQSVGPPAPAGPPESAGPPAPPSSGAGPGPTSLESPMPAVDTAAGPAAPVSRPRSVLAPVTLSLLALTAGLLVLLDNTGVVDVSLTAGTAVLLVLTGGALVVGAWWGTARWLIPVGIVLCLVLGAATLVDVPIRGGIGERVYEPAALVELDSPYRLAAGDMTVDLSGVDFGGQARTVVASVAAGRLGVVVPADVAVTVESHVSAGELSVLGETADGLDVDRTVRRGGRESGGRLVVRAEVGLGELEVTRAAA
jgi:phage shock protein PspC (stress-responsive transcriptional regulator)